jgi:YVTN family beta-propeller protein
MASTFIVGSNAFAFVRAHDGVVHSTPEDAATHEATPLGPTRTYQAFLPDVSVGSQPVPHDPSAQPAPVDDSHARNDYVLAEEARQRNEPSFVVPDDVSAQAAEANENVLGQWGPVRTWPFVMASAANLPDGRIIAWGGNNATSFNGGSSTFASIWDPTTDQFLSRNITNHSAFCAIPTMLEDGRVFLNGGDGTRERTSTFDWRTNAWTRIQDMSVGRWYNGAVALPDGRVITLIGDPGGRYPEIWNASTGWSLLTGADLQGPVLGQSGYQANWLPYLHLGPDGRIFHSGPTAQMNWINPAGNGSIANAGLSNTWYPKYAAGVMYDEGKILVTGGMQNGSTQAATNQAHIIDLTGPTPVKTVVTGMNLARKFHNAVVLPNGEVLMIGGNTSGTEFSDVGTQLPAEIWNPVSRTWRTVASISVPRNYHSVALLMPDGRVWSAGGGLCACSADHPDHQIYSPPYLFNADSTLAVRPVITTTPTGVGIGQGFSVQAVPGVQKFSLIKMSGVTHNLNSDLRFLNVPFTSSGNGTYQLTPSTNINVLTPGYWMLFALNSNGVPSIAKVIQFSRTSAPQVTNPGTQSTMVGTPATLQIVATDVNNDVLTYSATGLPTGLTINPSTGLINGTPNVVGIYNVNVGVSDGISTTNAAFSWNITPLAANLALNRTATSSSNETTALTPNLAVDGNTATRWSSAYSDPQWLQIDLGATRSITRVVLNWEVAYGRAYTVQVSNDAATWTNLFSTTTGDGGIDDLTGLSGSGRYVRVFGTQRGTQWGYSLWEVEVYGGLPIFTLNAVTTQPRQVNTSVSFTASTLNGVNPRYKWLFGDGSPETAYSTSVNASHIYSQPGLYVVKVTATDDSGVEKSDTFVQAIHQPSTTNRPNTSSNIAIASNRLWVVNQDNDSVSVFDANTNNKLAEIPVGLAPRSVAIAPNGNVWVANKGAATISVINPNTLAVAQTIALPFASQPYGVAFSPAGGSAYVALEGSGRLLKLDAASGAQQGSVDTGSHVRGVAVGSDGNTVYVSRFITPRLPGEETAIVQTNTGVGGQVIVVNAVNMSVANTIILQHSDKPDTEVQGGGLPNYLGAAAISPDGGSAWVPSKQDNIKRGTLRNGTGLNFQNTVRAIASRINLGSNSEDFDARVDHDNSSMSSAAAFDRYGNYVFVALETSREIALIDAFTNREIWRLSVGRAPQGLAVSPDGSRLYVSNFMDRSVTVFDLTALMSRGEKTLPVLATLNSVSTEKLSAQVLNGKQLFYDARDPRLARDGYMSCAACHNDGGQDGRVWDFTGFGEGLRNTIALNGRSGAQGFLHWSGNFNEVHDFEGQIRNFAGGTGLMTDAQFNTGTRNQPLGDPKAGLSTDLDALVSYLSSLNRTASSPLRNADGTLTTAAVAGRQVFINANCAQCHSGISFTNSGPANLQNIGTIKPTSGQRLNGTLTGIDVPTLRDVWATAPYLHDGSAATLADAVSAHNNVSLNAGDLENLVAYLQQIGDQEASAPTTNAAPSVNISTPAHNATFTAPATVNIAVTASDTDGSISRVEFFNGATKLGEDTTAPFEFAWTNVAAGAYALTARATDNQGGATTSTVVNITVNSAPTGGTGTILREWWTGISGGVVSDLTNNPNYPNNPTGSNQLTSFEAPANWAENYGTRVRGYVHPTVTGQYRFWLATDDYGELRLSTNDSPANAVVIANVPGWTNSREWTKYPQQQSTLITLQAGQKYYIEALQKEAGGGDNLAVAWQPPGGTQAVIPGANLSPWVNNTNAAPSVSISAPANNASFTAPATINISANASDGDGTISRVEFFNGATKLGEDTTAPYTFAWTNVVAGNYAIAAKATDNLGAATTSAAVNVTVSAAACSLPSGFASLDVGNPGQAGSACESGGTWTVRGGGADIWNASDQFRFAHQTSNAPTNATLSARVTSVQNTDVWAKAGVMFRDGTNANARFVMVVQMPNNEVAFQWRSSTGGSASWSGARVGGTASVKWVRLVKNGSTYTAFYSTATSTPTAGQWVQIGTSRSISMSNPRAGLAVTAHNNGTLCTATFTNVTVTSP